MKLLPNSLGNLGNINLYNCLKFEKLAESSRNLFKLKCIMLLGCSNLTMSNKTLRNISMFEIIDFPEMFEIIDICHCAKIKVFFFSVEVPCWTLYRLLGDLKNLKELLLIDFKELKYLSTSAGLLFQLTKLRVERCSISELPFKMIGGERVTLRIVSNWTLPLRSACLCSNA